LDDGSAVPALAWICPGCNGRLEESGSTLACAPCAARIDGRDGIWRAGGGFRPAGFAPERRAHLEALEADHFWFPPRRRLLAALLDRTPAGGGAAIDLGCGTGGFLSVLARRFATVVGVDAYGESLAIARGRAPGAELLEADATAVPLAAHQFDLAAALDVLEHGDPDALLGEARRLVRPGGWLLVSVPAFPSLWSELDEAAGHRRRYRRSTLDAELTAAGWRLVDWTHYQMLLFPLVWFGRRFPVRFPRRLERRPPGWLGALLGTVNDLEVALLARRRLPWGSSLLALARREGS
jgi:SAM-dependent methyltransferase